MAKLEIYGTPTSPPTRVARIAAMEFGHEFELKDMAWRASPKELFELNPAGRVPVLHHDGQVIFDSRQIWAYLEQLPDSKPHESVRPLDGPDRWREQNAATLAYEAQSAGMVMRGMAEEPPIEEHPYLARSEERRDRCLAALNEMASEGWLIDPRHFGLAEAVMICATDAMAGRGVINMMKYPHLEWIRERYKSRKSVSETLGDYFPGQRGGAS